ncbi:MAG: hypothetical protein LQ338_008212 [Usnochroma carphineum]|nr:MAG: hypothetical protein LQ338_008212 [Usnochroma carphineum]
MSWFWRGFQSAVFYYVSCAPCTKLAYRRRRRKGAARAKLEKEMEEGLYPHPSPFSTNIYWREEMALGPGPPQKKRDRDKERQQRSGRKGDSRRDLVTGNSVDTGTSSADTVVARNSLQGVAEMEQERRSEEGWNRRRYQREDEFLWGIDTGSEDGHPFEGTYSAARNPEVNDLHPPVVSTQPTHRSETRWMLQPPPSAKIMEGKKRANRSRSGSGGSNGSSRRGEIGLGRQIGERLVEGKRRKGQAPEPTPESAAMSRATSRESGRSNNMAEGQRHDRDFPPPARVSTDTASSTTPINISTDEPNPPPQIPVPGNDLHQRPPLQTIISSAATTHRPPLLQTTSTSSLRALQELTSPSTALNARPVSAIEQARLPPADEKEDRELEIPAVESFWPPPDGGGSGMGQRVGVGGALGVERRERWSCGV